MQQFPQDLGRKLKSASIYDIILQFRLLASLKAVLTLIKVLHMILLPTWYTKSSM